MARLTKQQSQEIIGVFYGINREYEVERVSLTRGGTLSRWNKNGVYSHPTAGRDPRTEVIVVFDLSDIVEVHQFSFGTEHEDKVVAEIKAKAAAKKAEFGKS